MKLLEIADCLGVSITTLQELKRKLKISVPVSDSDYLRLEKLVEDIRRASGGKVTLSTINDFKLYHKLEDY